MKKAMVVNANSHISYKAMIKSKSLDMFFGAETPVPAPAEDKQAEQ